MENAHNRSPRSLVTGGAGFIGSHVARRCVELGHDVVVLDDLSGGFRDQIPEGAQFIPGSITDHVLLERLFDEYQFDFVYHLAAFAAVGLSHFIRRFNYTVNLLGTTNLVNEAVRHEIKCFVFASSISVYGAGQLPMREDTVPAPEDPYGISKYAAEMDLMAAHQQFGLRYVVLRPHNVYGEHQNVSDPYRNVLGIFMTQILRDEPLSIFGDGEQTRAFTHVDDVAPLMAGCVDNPRAWNQVFNVGADQSYSINELAKMTSAAFHALHRVQHLPPRNEVVHTYASHDKVRDVFGVKVTVDLEAGLRRMAEWVQRSGPRRSQPLKSVEVSRQLPASWLRLIASSGSTAD